MRYSHKSSPLELTSEPGTLSPVFFHVVYFVFFVVQPQRTGSGLHAQKWLHCFMNTSFVRALADYCKHTVFCFV